MISLDGAGYYISQNEASDLYYFLNTISENKRLLSQVFFFANYDLTKRVIGMMKGFDDGVDVRKKTTPDDTYISVVIDGQSYPEHRFVYYKATHPCLSDSEIVEVAKKAASEGKVIHHIDGDKHNNNIFNLVELKDNTEHRRCHSYIYESPAERLVLIKKTLNEIGKGYVNIKIEESELPIRVYNCLHFAGFKTIKDIYTTGLHGIMKIRNFGEGCLNDLDKVLVKLSLPSIKDESKENMKRIKEIIDS